MKQDEIVKIVDAIFEKYDRAEACLLIVKLIQELSQPAKETSITIDRTDLDPCYPRNPGIAFASTSIASDAAHCVEKA